MTAKRGRPAKAVNDLSTMSAEEKEEFNAKRAEDEAKLKALEEKQAKTKSTPRPAVAPRDKSIIRGIEGDDQIECVTVRKIGIDNNETSEVDETVMLPKLFAKRLQDVGAIKIGI